MKRITRAVAAAGALTATGMAEREQWGDGWLNQGMG